MKDITVLITGAGTATCQSVIKALRSQNEFRIKIVAVDMQEESAGKYFSDKFYKVPAANDEGFISSLLGICKKEKVELLIPIVDYEFEKLSKHKPEFKTIGCTVVISDLETITKCNDKWKTFNFFKEIGIPTPETWLPADIETKQLKYPLYVKPQLAGRASIDVYRVSSYDELNCFLQKIDKPIIQQAIEGKEYTVDILCDFNGKALNGVVRERIETKSGLSYKGRTVKDKMILDMAIDIAEKLPVIGPSNIQCFKDEDSVYFSEVNPRYSGTLVLSIAAGFNSPLCLIELITGKELKPDIGNYKEGIYMMRYWQEVFVDKNGNKLPDLKIHTEES